MPGCRAPAPPGAETPGSPPPHALVVVRSVQCRDLVYGYEERCGGGVGHHLRGPQEWRLAHPACGGRGVETTLGSCVGHVFHQWEGKGGKCDPFATLFPHVQGTGWIQCRLGNSRTSVPTHRPAPESLMEPLGAEQGRAGGREPKPCKGAKPLPPRPLATDFLGSFLRKLGVIRIPFGSICHRGVKQHNPQLKQQQTAWTALRPAVSVDFVSFFAPAHPSRSVDL